MAEAGIRGQVTAEAGSREISQQAAVKSQAGEAGLLGVMAGSIAGKVTKKKCQEENPQDSDQTEYG